LIIGLAIGLGVGVSGAWRSDESIGMRILSGAVATVVTAAVAFGVLYLLSRRKK
jgi:hypothetical protein